MSVLMAARVPGLVVTEHVTGHFMTCMLVSRVRMQIRTGIRIAQDQRELSVNGRKHETRGNERAQQQHCEHKRRRPMTPATGARPDRCAPPAEIHSLASHPSTMPQRAVAIKLRFGPFPHPRLPGSR